MTYSRTSNPSVQMLEERIALMEGAEACRCQASGMGAMSSVLLCQLSAGDHMVIAKAAFGPTRWVTDNLLPRFGIEVTAIDGRDLNQWQDAIRDNTKLFFFETPANPTMDLVDIAEVSKIAHARGIRVVVDNAFASVALQRPLDHGADVVAYAATKLMDGSGGRWRARWRATPISSTRCCILIRATPAMCSRPSTLGLCSRDWKRSNCAPRHRAMRRWNWAAGWRRVCRGCCTPDWKAIPSTIWSKSRCMAPVRSSRSRSMAGARRR
jgi:hypothetical protein